MAQNGTQAGVARERAGSNLVLNDILETAAEAVAMRKGVKDTTRVSYDALKFADCGKASSRSWLPSKKSGGPGYSCGLIGMAFSQASYMASSDSNLPLKTVSPTI